jgi:ubiquinone/menaquinone biosynthesis C-methylase UbiE
LLTNARARSTEVQFQNARAESLPFFHDSFDLAFSVDVVHQVQDRLAAFQESFRVLKQGGKFCTVTHSEEIIRHRRPLAVYFRETVAVDLARYPSIAHIRHLVEQAGFQQLEEALVDFPYPLTDITAYRDKAFSCLHLISAEHFRRGIERMDEELQLGPIIAFSRYLMLWATKVDPLSEI